MKPKRFEVTFSATILLEGSGDLVSSFYMGLEIL